MKKLMQWVGLLLLLITCTTTRPSGVTPMVETVVPPVPAIQWTATLAGLCELKLVIVPTKPAVFPAINALDETTGLHMTGTVQEFDLASYRLDHLGAGRSPPRSDL